MDIEDKRDAIIGGWFGGGNFLDYPAPSFAYPLTWEKTVRVTLDYDPSDISLYEFSNLGPGSYSLLVRNRGKKGKATKVGVRRK